MDEVYETDEHNITKNFNANKERFKEKKHYYKLQGEELKEFKRLVTDSDEAIKFAPMLYLRTERGASRIGQNNWNSYIYILIIRTEYNILKYKKNILF